MKVLIFDGLNFIRRIFSAVPDHTRAGNAPPTEHAEAVKHAVIGGAQRAIKHHQASHAVMVFDAEGDTWRHQLFPAYKSQRKPQPAELTTLLPQLKTELTDIGIQSIAAEGYEADDSIATISSQLAGHSIENVILSSDKLLCQLLEPSTQVYDHFQKTALDIRHIQERFGIQPQQLPLYFALTGQSSVSIPGIAGIGAKTAAALLQQYPGTSELLTAAAQSEHREKRWAKSLGTHSEDLRLYQQLFTLKCDIQFNANLKDWRLPQYE